MKGQVIFDEKNISAEKTARTEGSRFQKENVHS